MTAFFADVHAAHVLPFMLEGLLQVILTRVHGACGDANVKVAHMQTGLPVCTGCILIPHAHTAVSDVHNNKDCP